MSWMMSLLLGCWTSLAAAGERGPAVGATVGMSVLGEVVGMPLGFVGYAGLRNLFPPECASDPDPLACEGFTLHVIGIGAPAGAALGGLGGAVLGSALIPNAPTRAVARNTAITAGIGVGLVLLTPLSESAGPFLIGAPVCLIGVPLVAGITAARAPDEERPTRDHAVLLDRVTPTLRRDGASLSLSGRF